MGPGAPASPAAGRTSEEEAAPWLADPAGMTSEEEAAPWLADPAGMTA